MGGNNVLLIIVIDIRFMVYGLIIIYTKVYSVYLFLPFYLIMLITVFSAHMIMINIDYQCCFHTNVLIMYP